MIGTQDRWQEDLFVVGSLRDLIPEDHLLRRVDKHLDLRWLRRDVADCYCENNGRPGIDPEAAIRLMLAGFFSGIVHDRKLMREAQVNLAIRWFAGYKLHETLPGLTEGWRLATPTFITRGLLVERCAPARRSCGLGRPAF